MPDGITKGKLMRVADFADIELTDGQTFGFDLVVPKDVRNPGPWSRARTSPALWLKPPTNRARDDQEPYCRVVVEASGK